MNRRHHWTSGVACQNLGGGECLISGEQQYFVWDAVPQSKKWLHILKIWGDGSLTTPMHWTRISKKERNTQHVSQIRRHLQPGFHELVSDGIGRRHDQTFRPFEAFHQRGSNLGSLEPPAGGGRTCNVFSRHKRVQQTQTCSADTNVFSRRTFVSAFDTSCVGAINFWWCEGDFSRITPNVPDALLCSKLFPCKFSVAVVCLILSTFTNCKIGRHLFFFGENFDSLFLKKKILFFFLKSDFYSFIQSESLITQEETKVSKLLCSNFQGFCPNFQEIKTFGGVLASPAPVPVLWQVCQRHVSFLE